MAEAASSNASPLPSLSTEGRGCGRFILALGLLGFLLVGGFVYLYLNADAKVRAFIAKLDQDEPGWRFEEIQAKRATIPDAENSAKRIPAIVSLLPKDWSSRSKPGEEISPESPDASIVSLVREQPTQSQLDPSLQKEVREYLDKVAPALREALALATMPNGRYEIEWPLDPTALIDVAKEARQLSPLLLLEVYRQAQENHPEEALRALHALMNVARSMGDEPHLLAQMAHMSFQWVLVISLERALAQTTPTEALLAALQSQIEEEASLPLLWYACRGERAQNYRLFEAIKAGQASLGGMPPPSGIGGLGERMMIRSWELPYLEVLTEAVEIARMPAEEQEKRIKILEGKRPSLPVLPSLWISSFAKTARTFLERQAMLRGAIVALAAERYRLKNGRWPDQLEEIVTAGLLAQVPGDPFGAGPLSLSKRPDGIVIYSFGHDEKDNQGTLDRRDPKKQGSDLGIQLWNPAARRQPAR